LVVIGTWLITKSLLLPILFFIPNQTHTKISSVGNYVTSLPCWGRVVIGSLLVYQAVGAGSNPVASTTVLVSAIRSIGNGQENCNSCAWESLEKSGLFPIPPAYKVALLILYKLTLWLSTLFISTSNGSETILPNGFNLEVHLLAK
jgi:hypothetical protein